jgi:hypothetical protein
VRRVGPKQLRGSPDSSQCSPPQVGGTPPPRGGARLSQTIQGARPSPALRPGGAFRRGQRVTLSRANRRDQLSPSFPPAPPAAAHTRPPHAYLVATAAPHCARVWCRVFSASEHPSEQPNPGRVARDHAWRVVCCARLRCVHVRVGRRVVDWRAGGGGARQKTVLDASVSPFTTRHRRRTKHTSLCRRGPCAARDAPLSMAWICWIWACVLGPCSRWRASWRGTSAG